LPFTSPRSLSLPATSIRHQERPSVSELGFPVITSCLFCSLSPFVTLRSDKPAIPRRCPPPVPATHQNRPAFH
ncbi:hypothetical protein IWX92DRAFT_316178, partial [Phyllosticta citricarpa]